MAVSSCLLELVLFCVCCVEVKHHITTLFDGVVKEKIQQKAKSVLQTKKMF